MFLLSICALKLIHCCVPYQVERDVKVGKMDADLGTLQMVEILSALQKLGEPLTSKEQAFLASHATDNLKLFEKASAQIGKMFVYISVVFTGIVP